MNRAEKALIYDDLVREGDRVNRQISTIKTSINRTPDQEALLAKLNGQLQVLEQRMNRLFDGE